MKSLLTSTILILSFCFASSQVSYQLDSISDHGSYQHKYLYNNLNQNTEHVIYAWDGTSLSFKAVTKNVFLYDNDGNCKEFSIFTFNKASNIWKGLLKYEMIYDDHKNIKQTFNYSWNNSSWVLNYRLDHENKYNDKGLLTTTNLHFYKTSGYELVTCTFDYYPSNNTLRDFRYTGTDRRAYQFVYDSINSKIEVYRYHIVNSSWAPELKTELLYKNDIDSKSLIKSLMYESHILVEPFNIFIQSMNFNNMITNEKQYTPDGSNWKFSNELVYHYIPVSINKANKIRQANSLVYPNPASDVINIKLKEPYLSNILEVFDNKGQKIMTKEIQQDFTLPINNFANGIYLIKITNKFETSSYKVLINQNQ